MVTPQGAFSLPVTTMGGRSAVFLPMHPEATAQQKRVGVLQIRGSDQLGHWMNPLLDWELRSASTPYDSLNELSVDFGLGGVIESAAIFEAVVPCVVEVDLGRQVIDDKAVLGLIAFRGLDREKLSIGYRIFDKGAVVDRGSKSGNELAWQFKDREQVGHVEIEVPPAALVNCYGRYDSVTYHSGWLGDPALVQNPRRATYERFDPGLVKLLENLAAKEKRFSRELESAVAALLWMLGFSSCHLGKNLQDGPDVLGTTPEGHVVVVECTIGGLKTDSKMARLLQRTAAVRDQLVRTSHQHLRVLPVMVTTLPAAEIAAEFEDAKVSGVYVLCSEGINTAVLRTLVPPRADQIFVEAEQELASSLRASSADQTLQ